MQKRGRRTPPAVPAPMVRLAALARGVDLESVARMATVSRDTLRNAINGTHAPFPSTRRLIAAALGVEVSDLFGCMDRESE